MRRRIIIDADAIITPRPSGIGSMTVQLIHALSENEDFTRSHKIVLTVPFHKVHLAKQWNFNDNVSIYRLPLTGKMMAALIRLRLLPPMDLLVGKGLYVFPNFRNWPLLLSKSITYIHDVSFNVFPEYVEKKNLAFLLRNVSEWMKRTDIVVTVSEHAKQEIARFYPDIEHKTRVVYNGIADAFTPLDKQQTEQALKEYGLVYKQYFIFLSNLEPRKNVNGLLAAYERFIAEEDHQSTKLILVGGMGWNNQGILEEVSRINQLQTNVIIPEHYVPDTDLPALLSGAAALVHPAHYEGFGISPLQAMACGTQIVVANNTSLPEVVGDGGIYVDDKSPEDILRGMDVAYNKRYENNTKGIERALKFSWKQSAKTLIQIIVELEGKT